MMRRTDLLAILGLGLLSSPLPAQGREHEPACFEPITRLTFDQELADGWTKRKRDPYQRLDDGSAPYSPPGIGRAPFRPGHLGGRGPIDVRTKLPPGYRSIYISFWVRFSESWVGHPSGVNKIFHIWIAGKNRVYLSAQGKAYGELAPQVRLQRINARPVVRNLVPRRGIDIRRGKWHHWELLLTVNEGGAPTGVVRWWLNGELAGDVRDVNLVSAEDSHDWGTVSWNPTWGGAGGKIEAEQFMDIDDIYISGPR